MTIFYADSVSDLVSVIKSLNLYEFTLWGRDLVSVVRIRERVRIMDFFFLRKYMRILSGHHLETVRIREVSVPRGKYNTIKYMFLS